MTIYNRGGTTEGNSLGAKLIATNQRVLAVEACQHESWLLLRLDMLF